MGRCGGEESVGRTDAIGGCEFFGVRDESGEAWRRDLLAFTFERGALQVQAKEESKRILIVFHSVGGAHGGVEGRVGVAEAVGAGGFEGAIEVAQGPAVGGHDLAVGAVRMSKVKHPTASAARIHPPNKVKL